MSWGVGQGPLSRTVDRANSADGPLRINKRMVVADSNQNGRGVNVAWQVAVVVIFEKQNAIWGLLIRS